MSLCVFGSASIEYSQYPEGSYDAYMVALAGPEFGTVCGDGIEAGEDFCSVSLMGCDEKGAEADCAGTAVGEVDELDRGVVVDSDWVEPAPDAWSVVGVERIVNDDMGDSASGCVGSGGGRSERVR